MLNDVLLIGFGGTLGAISRFLFSHLNRKGTSKIPVGTLIVNLLGAFLLGWVLGSDLSAYWKLFLGTGFLGAFTTFSTFKTENVNLFHGKNFRELFLYLGITYIGGIILAFVGLVLAGGVN